MWGRFPMYRPWRSMVLCLSRPTEQWTLFTWLPRHSSNGEHTAVIGRKRISHKLIFFLLFFSLSLCYNITNVNWFPRTTINYHQLCDVNPCLNGATCWTSTNSAHIGSFYCACKPGYDGKLCEGIKNHIHHVDMKGAQAIYNKQFFTLFFTLHFPFIDKYVVDTFIDSNELQLLGKQWKMSDTQQKISSIQFEFEHTM